MGRKHGNTKHAETLTVARSVAPYGRLQTRLRGSRAHARLLSAKRVPRTILYVGSIDFGSLSAQRHCNHQPQVHLRWCLVSICTRVPQWRCHLDSSSEQSNGRAAKDVHIGGLQQRFWAASMVLTTALPARPVWPVELSEDSLISDVDICRSFKPGSQAICYLGSTGLA